MGTVDLGVDSNMADNLTVEQESEVKEVGMVVRALGMNPSDEELQEMIEGKGDGVHLDFHEFLGIVGHRMNEVDNEDELREAGIDNDGQFRYQDFVDRMVSGN